MTTQEYPTIVYEGFIYTIFSESSVKLGNRSNYFTPSNSIVFPLASPHVVIPSIVADTYTVTAIYDRALSGCNEIESVTLPNTIGVIHASGMSYMKIKNLIIPKSLRELHASSLYGMSELTSIKFEEGSSLYSISTKAISDWPKLEILHLPPSLQRISGYKMENMKKLKYIL